MAVLFVVCLFAVAMLVLWPRTSAPLAEAPTVEFPSAVSREEKLQLLKDDFRIITDVNALPTPVLRTFKEKGGARLVLANPGAKFNPSDFISDASVPRRRLIFAGASTDKCFVHYEPGGRGVSYVVEVFGLHSGETVEPLWLGYCAHPVSNLEDLRSQIMGGACR